MTLGLVPKARGVASPNGNRDIFRHLLIVWILFLSVSPGYVTTIYSVSLVLFRFVFLFHIDSQ